MELILSTHSHSVDGTPLWTTIDFLSLTIKSLDNCLRCWLAAKHFLHNAKYLAMGFPHYPSWYLKSTYVCKIEKATKYLSLVTIKIFFECIFKFLKKKLNPNMTSKAPITHPNPSSVWYLAAGVTKDQAQARNALDWIICHRQIYVEYLYIIVCNIGQSAIVRRHWIC